jgi:hypothetical protein
VVAVGDDPAHRGAGDHRQAARSLGPGELQDRACSTAACSTADVMTSLATKVASCSVVAKLQPHTLRTRCSTRRVAQSARGVEGGPMLIGTVLD